MANTYLVGLVAIRFGEIAGDGGMSTSLATIGFTQADSASFETADGETINFEIEESVDPGYSKKIQGIKTMKFNLASPDSTQLVATVGGTRVTGPPVSWNAPDVDVDNFKSVQIEFETGQKLNIPKGQITARVTGQIGKRSNLQVEVTVTVLKPDKANTSSYSIVEAE